MENNNITKVPGISWAEIDGKVVEYRVDDQKAGQDVRDKIAEMYSKLEPGDHTPDTSIVLQHMSNRKKEVMLQSHSEKLVSAKLLLYTGQDMRRIRIVQNLSK